MTTEEGVSHLKWESSRVCTCGNIGNHWLVILESQLSRQTAKI